MVMEYPHLCFSVGESGANQIIIVNVDEQGSLSIA